MAIADLGRDGAQLFKGAARSQLSQIVALAEGVPPDRPGTRLTGSAWASAISEGSAIGGLARRVLPNAFPVRAVFFDKSAAANWALGWHQDRTIAVRTRLEVPGFGPWTCKQGIMHVAPPIGIIEQMITLRVYIDDVDADNAPLLVIPGSHRLGRIDERAVPGMVEVSGTLACIASAGDVWAYATAIVHASKRADRPRRRRVLQVDYAAGALPGGLRWLGV